MKDIKVLHIPGKPYWYWICSSQVLNFYTNRNCHFRLFLGGILARTQGPRQDFGSVGSKKILYALENDTKWIFRKTCLAKYSPKFCGFCLKFWPVMTWNMMQQMCYGFYWIWPKSELFDSFWVFMFITSYTLWFTPHGQMKDLIEIYIW